VYRLNGFFGYIRKLNEHWYLHKSIYKTSILMSLLVLFCKGEIISEMIPTQTQTQCVAIYGVSITPTMTPTSPTLTTQIFMIGRWSHQNWSKFAYIRVTFVIDCEAMITAEFAQADILEIYIVSSGKKLFFKFRIFW